MANHTDPPYTIVNDTRDNVLLGLFPNKSMILLNSTTIYDEGELWDANYLDGKEYTFLEWNTMMTDVVYPKYIRRKKVFLAICALVTIIGIGFVVARLYVRRKILKRFFVDDWLVLAAMASGIIGFVGWVAGIIKNISADENFINTQPLAGYDWDSLDYKIETIGFNTANACTAIQATLGRLSILYTFYRLSVPSAVNSKTRNLRILIHIVAALMVLETIAFSWLAIDPCWPPSGGWSDVDGTSTTKCLADSDHYTGAPVLIYNFLAGSIFNSIADAFSFALPFMVFRWAFISAQQRRGLYALFSFGFCILLISIFRAIDSAMIIRAMRVHDLDADIITTPYVFGFGEANGVMVGASLPVLGKPLLRWWKVKWHKSEGRRPASSTGVETFIMKSPVLETSAASSNIPASFKSMSRSK